MHVSPSAMRWLPLMALLACGACRSSERAPGRATRSESKAKRPAPPPLEPLDPEQLANFGPLPARFDSPENAITDAKVELGRLLFHDPRLSIGQDVSCNTCHDLSKHGADGRPVSVGSRGREGTRNTPTVLNAAGLVAQFWDGRAANVEALVPVHLVDPREMGMPSAAAVVRVVTSIPGYPERFARAFPDEPGPVTIDNLARAIGAFLRVLSTPTRFDRLLSGQDDALTAPERHGLRVFMDEGCPTCHGGPLVGGAAFPKLGKQAPYEGSDDPGRFEVTHDEADRRVFRSSSLRNVAATAPYYHDGRVPDLPTAVRTMARIQIGEELRPEQVDAIVTFLSTLTGEIDAAHRQVPEPLPSGPHTPAPRR